jgi:hypothetical protein
LIVPIQYLTYQQIDKNKWDKCIRNADNNSIYPYSFYLDSMARHWDALVFGDYEAVMPLTWNKKYGIHYLYQPPFTAHLGVFGKNLNSKLVNDFLKAIPAKFKYWDISLNHDNFLQLQDFDLKERINYVLPLQDSYDKLYGGFRENIQRNIKKCEQLNCVIKNDIAVDEVIELSKQQAGAFASLTDTDFNNIKNIFLQLHQKKEAVTYGVYSNERLVASAAFFFAGKRAYYILVGNHPDGKTIGASHALINAFIKDNAGKDLLLDFEGSDIHSLAFFYSSFGAVVEKYPAIKLNRLPFFMKWLKK